MDVSYLEWFHVGSSEDVDRLLSKATKMRSVGATAMNAQSSRSHMVFMLAIDGTNAATGQKLSGALNLIDLAGSERVDKSEVTGSRLKETTYVLDCFGGSLLGPLHVHAQATLRSLTRYNPNNNTPVLSPGPSTRACLRSAT